VLQQLLREQVSVRDLPSILETLLDAAATNKHPVMLVEAARQGLGRALVRPLLSDDGGLRVLTLDHSIEEELSRAFNPQAPPATGTGLQPSGLQPSFVRRILDGLRQLAGEQVAQTAPVLLCGTPARFSSAPPARTLPPQSCCALSPGNSSHGSRAVAGYGPMKAAMKKGRYPLEYVVGRESSVVRCIGCKR